MLRIPGGLLAIDGHMTPDSREDRRDATDFRPFQDHAKRRAVLRKVRGEKTVGGATKLELINRTELQLPESEEHSTGMQR